jgi:hypothetical protein
MKVRVPAIRSLWIHHKHDDWYLVTSVGRLETTGEWMVGYCPYRPAPNGDIPTREVFYRKLTVWFEQVDGVPRYRVALRQINMRSGEEQCEWIEPYGDESRFKAS